MKVLDQRGWSWQGAVAFIFALTIGVSVIAISIGVAIEIGDRRTTLSQDVAQMLSTILGAAIGSLATYLGIKVHDKEQGPEDTGSE